MLPLLSFCKFLTPTFALCLRFRECNYFSTFYSHSLREPNVHYVDDHNTRNLNPLNCGLVIVAKGNEVSRAWRLHTLPQSWCQKPTVKFNILEKCSLRTYLLVILARSGKLSIFTKQNNEDEIRNTYWVPRSKVYSYSV